MTTQEQERYEAGQMDDDELVVYFQRLVSTGEIGLLPPRYMRMATHLAAQRLIKMPASQYVVEAQQSEIPWTGILIALVVVGVLIAIPFLFLAFVHNIGI